jgi:hypothetical protein
VISFMALTLSPTLKKRERLQSRFLIRFCG